MAKTLQTPVHLLLHLKDLKAFVMISTVARPVTPAAASMSTMAPAIHGDAAPSSLLPAAMMVIVVAPMITLCAMFGLELVQW